MGMCRMILHWNNLALQNKAGNFVKANAETSAAGLGEIILDDQLRGADANPAGANAYPIVSLTWILGILSMRRMIQ